ncbi:MAG: PBP1A family penicillin-binding protein [Melioribacter sp.]|uniref:penicillin-binding protein 1A n=1 Tax=Rosettibacter primus TaxID=3111523 RepID=UPI00247B7B74|nr:PBP1A family penicillin-binding protein [Melioribacter sp.]
MIKNQIPSKKIPKKKKSKGLKLFILFIGIIIIAAFILLVQYIFEGLPSLDELENPKPQLASNVYSIDGELIGQFFKENRVEVSIDSIPPHVVNALIATEDRKFYDHWGVDIGRFIKAMFKNIFLFKREGASTITQQLAKNLYELKLQNESLFDTIIRKIREWITAVQIEKTYTKREILEMYFNIQWFGHGAYGIAMASKVYFDKDVKQLSIEEGALLIALLKSWVYYDPYEKYERALQRRNVVLKNMVDMGYLSEEEYEKLKVKPIKLSYKKIEQGIRGTIAPHFVEYIRQQMEKIASKYGYDLYRDGLNIYTTLDSRMQRIAIHAVEVHLNEFQKQFDKSWSWNKYKGVIDDLIDRAIKNKIEYRTATSEEERKNIYYRLKNNPAFIDSVKNAAKRIEVGFVVMDVKTGEIRAMVGGRNQRFLYGLNHVTQIKRQPGSAFKPIVYTVAIDRGLYPAYPILNQPFNYNGWSPQNFDLSTGGFTTLRQGLAYSINIVAARLIIEDYAPLPDIGRIAERLGIKSQLELYPSIALGTSLVSPLELTTAYATLANHGIYNEPISILKIEDKDGMLIDKFVSESREAISEETAYIVTDMMRTAIDQGTGVAARYRYNFQRPAAGKTGTTQDFADAWFVGFTPQLVGGVWVGFDDQRISFTGEYGQGARAALPIWAIFMHDVYEQLNLPMEDFQPPASGNVVPVKFCRESIFEYGNPKLYSADCRGGVYVDIANIKSLPESFDAFVDNKVIVPNRYSLKDSTHEAKEIR